MLDRCKYWLLNGERKELTESDREKIMAQNSAFARSALRVLAYAIREMDTVPKKPEPEEIENELTFVGLTGMIDPPREEAKEAIQLCKQAGIVPVMITGDYKDTAYAIAEDLGMVESEDQAIMGRELNDLTDEHARAGKKQTRVRACQPRTQGAHCNRTAGKRRDRRHDRRRRQRRTCH